jgi:hypothetical protein
VLKNPYLDSFIWLLLRDIFFYRCVIQRGLVVWAPFLKKYHCELQWGLVLAPFVLKKYPCELQRGLVVLAPFVENIPLWITARPSGGSFCSAHQEATEPGTPVLQPATFCESWYWIFLLCIFWRFRIWWEVSRIFFSIWSPRGNTSNPFRRQNQCKLFLGNFTYISVESSLLTLSVS